VSDITTNVASILSRVRTAAARAGRDPQTVTLVAVTKTHPVETVIEGYRAGLRHFGENRVFEKEKIAELAQWLAGQAGAQAPTWHFIGHLQSRQVGQVLGSFALIHAVDSLKLAQRLDRLVKRDGYPPVEILLQGNVSGEASKAGFDLSRWQTDGSQLTRFVDEVRQIAGLEGVVVAGLMTMAPIVADPEETRPVFRSLAALAQTLKETVPEIDWGHLSMGMTDDFEVAIEEGATLIRVGRAIFGERQETDLA
jgi:hypothetical protein